MARQLDLSVILVHPTRKNAPSGVAAGQGLRGSSDQQAVALSKQVLGLLADGQRRRTPTGWQRA